MKMKPAWIPVLLASAIALSACVDNSDLKWTEDVKLPDGRVITLKRWVEFKGGATHFGDRSTESREWFEFKHPASGEVVRWENNKAKGTLHTVALWFIGDAPVLLTAPAYGGDLSKYLCPNPPYLLFEYKSGVWQEKPLGQIGIKRIRSNLTSHPMESRKSIEKSRHHLNEEQTSDSHAYVDGRIEVPYILVFDGMGQQTFRQEDCSRISNLRHLLATKGN